MTKQIHVQKFISNLPDSTNKIKLMVSYEAFLLNDEINLSSQKRIAKHLNGFIVTESDSEGNNASIIHSASSPLDPSLQAHIKRGHKAIK